MILEAVTPSVIFNSSTDLYFDLFQGYCVGFQDVLTAYNKITPKVQLSGPTNFAPLIKQAISIVKQTKSVSILI